MMSKMSCTSCLRSCKETSWGPLVRGGLAHCVCLDGLQDFLALGLGGLAHCVCLDGPQDVLALGVGIGLGTGLRIFDGLLQAQL